MNRILCVLIITAFFSTALACRNIVKSYSSCKGVRTNKVTIEYVYSKKFKTLHIVHKGAMLNCCLSNITASYAIMNKKIIIEEQEKLRELCKCVCPYDVKMKIDNLSAATYIIEIGRFSMKIDLINNPQGTKTFLR